MEQQHFQEYGLNAANLSESPDSDKLAAFMNYRSLGPTLWKVWLCRFGVRSGNVRCENSHVLWAYLFIFLIPSHGKVNNW